MNLSTAIRSERFTFADLREVFAKASEEKSGDQLAGLAAQTERERVAAKVVLSELTLDEIVTNPLIDPDGDEVSRLCCETLDAAAFATLRGLTMGEFREWILDDATTGESIAAVRWGSRRRSRRPRRSSWATRTWCWPRARSASSPAAATRWASAG